VRIRTVKKSKNLPRDVCRRAVAAWGEYLFGKRLAEHVSVTVHFDPRLIRTTTYATCEWGDEFPPRDFLITVSPELSRRMTLFSIAHEMVHCRQYARLIWRPIDEKTVRWKNEIYPADTDLSVSKYWLSPWEIECRGYEEGLYRMFMIEERRRGRVRNIP